MRNNIGKRKTAPELPPRGTPITKWLPQGPLGTKTIFGKQRAVLTRGYYGIITPNQEIYCWYLAAGYTKQHAAYKAYGFRDGQASFDAARQNAHNRFKRQFYKLAPRIQELLELHREGHIDLEMDPWRAYNGLIDGFGDPEGDIRAHRYAQASVSRRAPRRHKRKTVGEVRAMLAHVMVNPKIISKSMTEEEYRQQQEKQE